MLNHPLRYRDKNVHQKMQAYACHAACTYCPLSLCLSPFAGYIRHAGSQPGGGQEGLGGSCFEEQF